MLNVVDGETELVMWDLPKLHKAAIKGPLLRSRTFTSLHQSSHYTPNFQVQELPIKWTGSPLPMSAAPPGIPLDHTESTGIL